MNKKPAIFLILLSLTVVNIFAQSGGNVTNNNSITIQGNVYYFRPSTTPSSPPPTQSSDFLGSGHWYGEDAAKAWATIADWVVDHCLLATSAIIGSKDVRVYISGVHVVRSTDHDFKTFWRGNYSANGGLDWVIL